MRIGIGYDIHRLVEERPLFLGGVEIPYIKGLLGYSDGDVLLHAIADAILGAMALGDIGQHFPDSDPQYKNIRSRELVKKVMAIVREKKFVLKNVDIVILAEEPKVYPFKDKMLDELEAMLEIGRDYINVKATTNEGVGSIGRGDAIAAYAVALLEERGDAR
ncbi:MAG: 2-C-methyl-D-erythritol 2,4-cyclodiphosphate synthase [Candidatus Omnitrophica bacterium]|nr:2-C-methyl-D-erythritol 2,4-cyclodiphosphate synthase [Candidatus Omnitrophota bacterium]MDD5436624.1 2-C-methyl-D-erythritol 2,4-cyclodiphosphate synthase [Candidatus Omnitrophota bacterium]